MRGAREKDHTDTEMPPAPINSRRPLANPNLFKPPPSSTSPGPGSERKVAFRDGTDDIDAYNASPKFPPKDSTTGAAAVSSSPAAAARASKWQPLSAVEPSPIAENDPFSLGDSEDEKDAKDKKAGGPGPGEIKLEDSERLRQAAAEAMADSLVDDDAAAVGADKKPLAAGGEEGKKKD